MKLIEDEQEISMEELLESYLKAIQEQENLDASIHVLRTEMQQRLDAEGIKGKVVGDYSVTKVTRTNFKPTLQQAKELTATKIVEQIDTAALKRLHEQGIEIPNTTTTSFVMVKRLEQAAE